MAAIFSRKRDVIRLLPALAQSYSLYTAASVVRISISNRVRVAMRPVTLVYNLA